MNKIRIGLIGLGRWARITHIPNLQQIDGVEISAICDLDAGNVTEALDLIDGSPVVYNDYRQLLAGEHLDAVMVLVPNFLHKQVVIAALQAGKHVFCEKPLVTTIAEYREVEKVQQGSGRILQVGFELRYAPFYRKMKELVAEGRLGSVRTMSCHITRGPLLSQWRTDDRKTGGVLLELCSHQFDLLSWYADSQPQRVYAVGNDARVNGKQLLNGAWVSIQYQNGINALLGLGLFTPFFDEVKFGLNGAKGVLDASFRERKILLFEPDHDSGITIPIPDSAGAPEHGFAGARTQLEDFLRAMRENREPMNNLQTSKFSLQIALAAQRSLRTGQPVGTDHLSE